MSIFIDHAEKRKDLPDVELDKCPHCGGELDEGFGLAGGGYGIYQYCEACALVVSKIEIDEEDP